MARSGRLVHVTTCIEVVALIANLCAPFVCSGPTARRIRKQVAVCEIPDHSERLPTKRVLDFLAAAPPRTKRTCEISLTVDSGCQTRLHCLCDAVWRIYVRQANLTHKSR